LKPFQFLLENIDSSSEKKEFLPVFMMEKVSSLWLHNDPREQRERIEAYRTSGMKNEVVLHFLEGMNQLTNVYSNSIILFGKEFISPLSDDASSYYDFKAADTQYIDGRRFLHLLFYPRRPGDNVFSGDCLIDHNSWAVSVITLEISPTAKSTMSTDGD
jgi:hypothetical protein